MNITRFNTSRWYPVNADHILGCWNSAELRYLVDIPEEHTVGIFIVEVIIMRTQNEDLGSTHTPLKHPQHSALLQEVNNLQKA